jgi:hypothetical protein
MTQGYSLIADKLKTNHLQSVDSFSKTATEHGPNPSCHHSLTSPLFVGCLMTLAQSERRALEGRMAAAREYLQSSEELESRLQRRYASLRADYESLTRASA